MPHNRGRRFWCCPHTTRETREKCFWEWEDGTKPYSAESEARFDAWVDAQGGCAMCAAAAALGFGGCCCD